MRGNVAELGLDSTQALDSGDLVYAKRGAIPRMQNVVHLVCKVWCISSMQDSVHFERFNRRQPKIRNFLIQSPKSPYLTVTQGSRSVAGQLVQN